MKPQETKNKMGEIEFRRKLFSEQILGKNEFDGALQYTNIESILLERMAKTESDFNILFKKIKIPNFYLEIGAERCQRDLVLENNFNVSGAAFDISYDMLKSCEYYGNKFAKNKLPMRICGDAYLLPFKSNSIPFVFGYEMLHHFPDPTPIIKEVFRVLEPGGSYYFDEEPFKQFLHFPIYKKRLANSNISGNSIYNRILNLMDSIFLDENFVEQDYDVIENHDISIAKWKSSFSDFYSSDIKLMTKKKLEISINSSFGLKYFIAFLFGGIINGLCKKQGGPLKEGKNTIIDTIICPNCLQNKEEHNLFKKESFYICNICNHEYPIKDNILFLLTPDKRRNYYPNLEF